MSSSPSCKVPVSSMMCAGCVDARARACPINEGRMATAQVTGASGDSFASGAVFVRADARVAYAVNIGGAPLEHGREYLRIQGSNPRPAKLLHAFHGMARQRSTQLGIVDQFAQRATDL